MERNIYSTCKALKAITIEFEDFTIIGGCKEDYGHIIADMRHYYAHYDIS